MINKYLNLLTKEDLNLFSEKSKFIENKSNSENYAYFSIEVYGSNYNYKLPDNFEEIGEILYKLGAIGSPIRISNNDEDGFFAIDNIFFGKIELLKKILFEQETRKNALLLDKITNKLIKQSIRPQTIIQLLNIKKDELINFNNIEILIHAISIKYPEKLVEIMNIFNEGIEGKIENENFKKKINNSLLIDKNGIKFYKNLEYIQIGNDLYKLKDFKNRKYGNSIYILYTLLKSSPKESFNDYFSDFKINRKEIFQGRNTKTSKFSSEDKSRFKAFLKDIKCKIINKDSKIQVTIDKKLS